MYRKVKVALNKFPFLPQSLIDSKSLKPVTDLTVDLVKLYHHYFMDSYGMNPPYPSPDNSEYFRFLLPMSDFRFVGHGPGVGKAKKRAVSNEFGQAFCRWFLQEHLDITYFAHMEHVLNKKAHPAFGGICVKRIKNGDTPDYLCVNALKHSYIAEAKGRYSSINFANAKFDEWRQQFNRIQLEDAKGNAFSVKGYIAATRFATAARPSIFTTIHVEDPATTGDLDQDFVERTKLGIGVAALHYSSVLLKIRLDLLSEALREGFDVPFDFKLDTIIWKCLAPPFEGVEFAGGLYNAEFSPHRWFGKDARIVALMHLDYPAQGTFFGVRFDILRQLRGAIAGDWNSLRTLPTLDVKEPSVTRLSWLKDGTVLGPGNLFMPVRVHQL